MIKRLFIILSLSLLAQHMHAQCSFRNTAIRGSEYISYNLYYNWQFVWVKAGTATMSTVETTYHGKKAFRRRCSRVATDVWMISSCSATLS